MDDHPVRPPARLFIPHNLVLLPLGRWMRVVYGLADADAALTASWAGGAG